MLQVQAAMLLAVELHAELYAAHGLNAWRDEAQQLIEAGRMAVRQCEAAVSGEGEAIAATTMPSGQQMRILASGISVQSAPGAITKEGAGKVASGAAAVVHVVVLDAGEKVQVYADGSAQVTTTGATAGWIGGQLRLAADGKTMVAVRLRKEDRQPIQTQWTEAGVVVQMQRLPAETRVQMNPGGGATVMTADKIRVEIPQIAAVVHTHELHRESDHRESDLSEGKSGASASDKDLVVDQHEGARKTAVKAAEAVAKSGVTVFYGDGSKAQVGGETMRLKVQKADGTVLVLLHAGNAAMHDDDDDDDDSEDEDDDDGSYSSKRRTSIRRPGGRRSMYVVTKQEPGRMGMLRAEADHSLVVLDKDNRIEVVIGPDGKPVEDEAASGAANSELTANKSPGGGDPLAGALSSLMAVGAPAAGSDGESDGDDVVDGGKKKGGKEGKRRINNFNSGMQLEMMKNSNLVHSVVEAQGELPSGASKKVKKAKKKAQLDVRWGKVSALVRTNDWAALIAGDQLKREIAAGRTLTGFGEAPIVFAPTFKVARHEAKEVYNEKRTPSWTDRVVFKSITGRRDHLVAIPDGYTSCPSLTTSDHKPVRAAFKVRLPESPAEHLIHAAGERSPCCVVTHLSVTLDSMKTDCAPYVKFYVDPNDLLGDGREKMPRSDILKVSTGTSRSVAIVAEEGEGGGAAAAGAGGAAGAHIAALPSPGSPSTKPSKGTAGKKKEAKEEKKKEEKKKEEKKKEEKKERVERSWTWNGNQLPHLHLAVERPEQLAVVEAHLLLALFAKETASTDTLVGQCVVPLGQISVNGAPNVRRGSSGGDQKTRKSSSGAGANRGVHKFDEPLVINGRQVGKLQCSVQVLWPGDEAEVSELSCVMLSLKCEAAWKQTSEPVC
jgi:hypothetical protein